tara:strand:- start:5026 stop:6747 length:1722 start_codon:yes stop_codon:yes gene_type:complete
MAISIKYFNSFILKKNVNAIDSGVGSTKAAYSPVFSGLPWNPSNYPLFSSTGFSPQSGRVANNSVRNWIIEESRLKGGFNETQTGYGVRAYLREDSNEGEVRENALIYSGIYNSNTGINETNVFSVGEEITKAVDPANGSIQKIHALDTNLAIFQENKVSSALIDKDAIFSAEGSGAVTSTNLVIGQITPYVGEYGISTNPESFAVFGYRRYFTDKYRNAVMRLSRDGLTEISQYGMRDFFRDKLSEINDQFNKISFDATFVSFATSPNFSIRISSNLDKIEKGMQVSIPSSIGRGPVIATVVGFFGSTSGSFLDVFLDKNPGSPTGVDITFTKYTKDKIVGGFDNYDDLYIVSLQKETNFETETTGQENISTNYYTTSFDEGSLGWTSFYDYKPSFAFSLKNNYYTTFISNLYRHHSNQTRSNFYGTRYGADITFLFNSNPSIVKNFKTVNYEGSNGWQVESFLSDSEGFDIQQGIEQQFNDSANSIKSYDEGAYIDGGIEYRVGFNRKENKYFANLVNNSAARPGEVLFGNTTTGIKGYFTTVKLSTDATTDVGGSKELFAVSTEFVVSSR